MNIPQTSYELVIKEYLKSTNSKGSYRNYLSKFPFYYGRTYRCNLSSSEAQKIMTGKLKRWFIDYMFSGKKEKKERECVIEIETHETFKI